MTTVSTAYNNRLYFGLGIPSSTPANYQTTSTDTAQILNDSDPKVKEELIEGLIRSLKNKDTSQSVRDYAIDRLVSLGPDAVPELCKSGNHEVIAKMGKTAIPTLISILDGERDDEFGSQSTAIRALGAMGIDAKPALDKLFQLFYKGIVHHSGTGTNIKDVQDSLKAILSDYQSTPTTIESPLFCEPL